MFKFLGQPIVFHALLYGLLVAAAVAISAGLGFIPGISTWGDGWIQLTLATCHALFLSVTALVLLPIMKGSPPKGLPHRWLGFVWIVVGIGIGFLAMVGSDGPTFRAAFYSSPLVVRIFYSLLTVVGTPVCEELFFRKLMIDPFPGNRDVASFMSALCFVFAHNRVSLSRVVSSIVLVLAYRTTGKLWVAIATHAVWNAVLFLVYLS